jgi:hypothetical protein
MAAVDVVRIAIKCFLALVFLLAGITKVTPSMHAESHIELDLVFRNAIGPLWQKIVFDQIDYKLSAVDFKFCIGFAEIAIAIMLWGPKKLSSLACVMGFCIMVGATLTHFLLEESFVFTFILGSCCLLVLNLGKRKSSAAKKSK